jgi:hypothetical protein
MSPLIQRKSTQGVVAILSIVMLPVVIWAWIGFVRQTHTRAVARDWGTALRENDKVPPGLGRAEDLLARLKRIDTGYAPDELKSAVHDYIADLEGSIEAAKAGHDTTSYDQAMDQAKQRLIAVAKKYD